MLDENTKNQTSESLSGDQAKIEKKNEKETAEKEKETIEKIEDKVEEKIDEKTEEKIEVENEVKETSEEQVDDSAVEEKAEMSQAEAESSQVEADSSQAAAESPESETNVAETKDDKESKEVSESTGAAESKEATESKDATESTEEPAAPKDSLEIKVPNIQFAKLSLDDLVKILEEFLREYDIRDIRQQIEELKSNFTKKFKALLKEKREEHLKGGGEESGFFYDYPVKARFDQLIRDYKRKRQQYYKDIEREQKENLEIKLKLIDELKDLIDTAEPATMYKSFKDLQERWKAVGQIPRGNYNDVWRTYHHHVERFYDLLHLNNDFRDLDFKHNLEEKTKLVEVAEKLAENEDVNHAFKELQILHRMWKEEIGPVAREHREEIWKRFSEATKKIHEKRHELQDQLEEKYRANVDLKLAVVEKIQGIDFSQIDSHKLWQEQIRKLEQLRDEFFAIGKVPKSKSEEVWQAFRKATKEFNTAKNNFYKNLKKDQAENLQKKMDLVEQAESLKDSENWDEATEVFKKIQAEWKNIGHVPRKDSDKIWKRFKEACNHYFDRLHEKKSDITQDQSKVIDSKKNLLDELKEMLDSKDLSLDSLEEKIGDWRGMGTLPAKVRHLESKFGKILDTAYKKLGLDKEEAEFLKFKNLVDSYLENKNTRKLDNEQMFIRKKVDEITREIKQLENNISFISNASEDNPLVKNVYKNIENYKAELQIWKRKLDYLSRMDY